MADGESSPGPAQGSIALADRLGALLTDASFAVVAFGLLLAWGWMGLVEGVPVFMDGAIDTPAVALLLASFAASLLACGLVRRVGAWLARPALWAAAGACMCAGCALLACVSCGWLVGDGASGLLLTRCAMVPVGLGLGVLVQLCAVAFASLEPVQAAAGFFLACGVMFMTYFVLYACAATAGELLEKALFCLLPLAAAALLALAREPIAARLAVVPGEASGFARGYLQMCAAYTVFFFAAAAKAAIEPAHEFTNGSTESVVATLLLSVAFACLVLLKRRPLGVFKLLKVAYTAGVLLLAVCIALARLSIDPLMSVVFNVGVVMLAMVLWLLVAFVAHANEERACKVVAVALACSAVGMAAGWAAGAGIHGYFGHDRVYFSVGLACAVAVFSTVGFSPASFPYLIKHGEAAKKLQAKKAAPLSSADLCRLMARDAGLSAREAEVLELLMEGYNAVAIADRMHISYSTARTHVRNIYAKTGVHSHAELIEARERLREEREGRGPDPAR